MPDDLVKGLHVFPVEETKVNYLRDAPGFASVPRKVFDTDVVALTWVRNCKVRQILYFKGRSLQNQEPKTDIKVFLDSVTDVQTLCERVMAFYDISVEVAFVATLTDTPTTGFKKKNYGIDHYQPLSPRRVATWSDADPSQEEVVSRMASRWIERYDHGNTKVWSSRRSVEENQSHLEAFLARASADRRIRYENEHHIKKNQVLFGSKPLESAILGA